MLEILFKCWKYRKFPKIKIFVDGDLLEEVHFNSEQQAVKIPLSILDGEHVLEIEHFDKTSKDTKVAEAKIVEDTKFRIESVKINGYEIPYTPMLKCKFVPDWHYLVRPKNFPNVLKQVVEIGPNGVWNLPFTTPIEDYIINERRTSNKENLKKIVTYESYEPDPDSIIDYQMTAQDKQIIKEIKELLT